MSVREEDRQNKNCPSRGLGIAAAAIGVGVGAALYYFFSKRPENPHEEGSTSTWECEPTQTFMANDSNISSQDELSDESYTTISEHSTTDTSIHTSPFHESEDYMTVDDDASSSSSDSDTYSSDSESSSNASDSSEYSDTEASNDSLVMDSDWEWTDSSTDVPEYSQEASSGFSLSVIRHRYEYLFFRQNKWGKTKTRQMTEEEQILRAQAFRERSWSLEECSICFEVILKNQEVMSLPCTHHFHTACILPWLQEQQTCPNCRKAAE